MLHNYPLYMNVSFLFFFFKKKKGGVEITKMHRNISQIHVAFYPKKIKNKIK